MSFLADNRRRVQVLLGIGRDQVDTTPEVPPSPPVAQLGADDAVAYLLPGAITASVYAFADVSRADQARHRLEVREDVSVTSSNGALLLYATADGVEADTPQRLSRLASRFAGNE